MTTNEKCTTGLVLEATGETHNFPNVIMEGQLCDCGKKSIHLPSNDPYTIWMIDVQTKQADYVRKAR